MISDADLDAIFATGDQSVTASFATTPTAITVKGHFYPGTDGTTIYGVEVEAVKPAFNCKTSSIATVSRGMSVTINAVAYTVERIQKIGNGTSCVYLKS